MNPIYKSLKAFTLAEVLVTISIIGIVAALTVPSLLQKIQDNQFKEGYKKAYSSISQAFAKASQEGDIVALTGTWSHVGGQNNFDAIKKQFKVMKSCEPTEQGLSGCWNLQGEKWRAELTNVSSFVDTSGVQWRMRVPESASSLSPTILVDVNGDKKPNQYGRDRFVFQYTNANTQTWSTVNDLGYPTKIMPLNDIKTVTETNLTICPSLQTHPCYFTTWLLE